MVTSHPQDEYDEEGAQYNQYGEPMELEQTSAVPGLFAGVVQFILGQDLLL